MCLSKSTLRMGNDLENVVGSVDIKLGNIDLHNNNVISSSMMFATIFTSVGNHAAKALPVASQIVSYDANGLNLGVSLIKNEFAGFTGIAMINTPYEKSMVPLVPLGVNKVNRDEITIDNKIHVNNTNTFNDPKKDYKKDVVKTKLSYFPIKIPRTYVGADIISNKKMSETSLSDIVSFKHYCFTPNNERGCDNIYDEFENDLVKSKFCNAEEASRYVLAVTDALQNYRPKIEWNKYSTKVYVLCIDNKPSSNGADTLRVVKDLPPNKNAKSIYLLRCWTHDLNHLHP